MRTRLGRAIAKRTAQRQQKPPPTALPPSVVALTQNLPRSKVNRGST